MNAGVTISPPSPSEAREGSGLSPRVPSSAVVPLIGAPIATRRERYFFFAAFAPLSAAPASAGD